VTFANVVVSQKRSRRTLVSIVERPYEGHQLFGPGLQVLDRLCIQEYMVVDVPELSYASSFCIVEDEGQGQHVARDDFGLKFAACKVELPIV
jgi:hypothetical protein